MRQREQQHQLQIALAKCAAPKTRLVAFIEGVRYDEATSVLGVEQADEVDMGGGPALPRDSFFAVLSAMCDQDFSRETVPAKLFQTESTWGALLAVEPDSEGHPTEYIMLGSEFVSTPQVLQRTTAECIAAALLLSSCIRHQTVAGFRWKMRMVCSDRYSAQFAAERGVAAVRGWQKLHLPCEIHMSTGAMRHGLGLMHSAITSAIRFALSLRLAGGCGNSANACSRKLLVRSMCRKVSPPALLRFTAAEQSRCSWV